MKMAHLPRRWLFLIITVALNGCVNGSYESEYTGTMIHSDLTHFRTLLGESENLATFLEAVEISGINQQKILITYDSVKDNELKTELISLSDIGTAIPTEKGFEIDFKFASWLLEHVSNTSDRLSFSTIFDS